jgi:hypothetical protein
MKGVSTTAAAPPPVLGKGRFRNLLGTAMTSLALIAALSACTSPTSNQDVVPPPEPETSAPATGEPEITPDVPGGVSKPSVSLPQLPVGGQGSFVDETENLQCANVSWIVEEGGPAELQDGIRIAIDGFTLDVHTFRITGSGCEDEGPTCVGYTFTSQSGNPACSLAVRTRRPLSVEPVDLELKIAGTIQCVDVSLSTCQAFIQAAQEESGSIELALPSVDTPETPTPDTQPSDDQTDEPADGELTPNSGESPTSGEATPGETAQTFI